MERSGHRNGLNADTTLHPVFHPTVSREVKTLDYTIDMKFSLMLDLDPETSLFTSLISHMTNFGNNSLIYLLFKACVYCSAVAFHCFTPNMSRWTTSYLCVSLSQILGGEGRGHVLFLFKKWQLCVTLVYVCKYDLRLTTHQTNSWNPPSLT